MTFLSSLLVARALLLLLDNPSLPLGLVGMHSLLSLLFLKLLLSIGVLTCRTSALLSLESIRLAII